MTGEENGESLTAEGEGTSVGEAKWSAIKALEPEFPGIEADDVEFEVLDAGDEEAGTPARVLATVDPSRWDEAKPMSCRTSPPSACERWSGGSPRRSGSGLRSTSSRTTRRSRRP